MSMPEDLIIKDANDQDSWVNVGCGQIKGIKVATIDSSMEPFITSEQARTIAKKLNEIAVWLDK